MGRPSFRCGGWRGTSSYRGVGAVSHRSYHLIRAQQRLIDYRLRHGDM